MSGQSFHGQSTGLSRGYEDNIAKNLSSSLAHDKSAISGHSDMSVGRHLEYDNEHGLKKPAEQKKSAPMLPPKKKPESVFSEKDKLPSVASQVNVGHRSLGADNSQSATSPVNVDRGSKGNRKGVDTDSNADKPLVHREINPDVKTEHELQQEEKKKHLGQRLIDKGLISADQLDAVLKEQEDQKKAGTKKMLGALFIEMGLLTESALGEVLSESFGVKSFDIKKAVLDPNLIKKLPKEVALRHRAIPVAQEDTSVRVAITDVYNILAIDQIRKYFPLNYTIVPVYSVESDLLEVIDQYYGYETSIKGILKEIETGISDKSKKIDGEQEGYVNPTVRLVDAILVDAIKKGSSDIHFEPEAAFIRLRYRIDGKLIQIRSFHKDYWSAIVVRIKILSGMNIAEIRNPQDGRASYSVLGREIDFRVATHPTVFGENIVMRILDKHKALMPMEKLGLSEHNNKLIRKILNRPEGIIVVTGPTGSGKTTTLYSILSYINSVDVNIMTLEDPVEYQLPMLRQSNIKKSAGMDFTGGIKSLLRQDPDIIFVGEVRDESTATMAMRAAMTGHKVFTTLHTNDAISSINRLVDIGVAPHLLAGTLICVISQRLVRSLCSSCKKSRHATEKETKILGGDVTSPPVIYQPVGCDKCVNGYKGRIGVHEILPISKKMDELIAMSATRENILQEAKKAGFLPISIDGISKVKAGLTTFKELAGTVDLSEYI